MLNTKTTNGHSLLSPSSAHRWSLCSASVRLSKEEDNKSNAMADRGTNIHWLAENLFNNAEFTVGEEVPGEKHIGAFIVEADMLEEAESFVAYAKALMTDDSAELFAEAKVMIIPEFDISGHVDCTIIDGTTLHILDLKTGRNAVQARGNLQMQLYALGSLIEHSMFYEFDTVVLHIVQDNAKIHNSNSWETTPELLEEFLTWVTERARLALQEDSICTPSESACRWCSHASHCKAVYDYTMDIVETQFEDFDAQDDEEVTLQMIADLLAKKKLADKIFKEAAIRLEASLLDGKIVDGWKLVQKKVNKRWVNEIDTYKKLITWYKKDEITTQKLITPTQAIALIGKDASTKKQNIFNTLWEQPDGEAVLAPESDRRKAVEPMKELDADY